MSVSKFLSYELHYALNFYYDYAHANESGHLQRGHYEKSVKNIESFNKIAVKSQNLVSFFTGLPKACQVPSHWFIILFAHFDWSTLIMTSSKRTISLKNSYKFHQNTFPDLVRRLLIYLFLQRGFIYFADRIESFKSFKTLELLAMVSVPLLTPS